MSQASPVLPARNARIDFLRGIAISVVLILHFSLAFGLKDSPIGSILPDSLLIAIIRNGNYGVTIFFVISGFLITTTSLQRWGTLSRIDAGKFYLYRFARIMPSLLLVLAIIVALGTLGLPFFSNTDGGHNLPPSYFLIGAGSVLTFWHNVLMQTSGYFNYCLNIYWSLSVEEVFYLAMPIICLSLRRTWLVVAVCCLAIALGPWYRSVHLDNEIFFMYGYAACFDAIAIGCLAAILVQQPWFVNRYRRVTRIASLIVLGIFYLRGINGHEIAGFTLIALASAGFLVGSANDTSPGWSSGRLTAALRWFGRYSYEIYLFHIVVLALMRNVITKQELSYAARLPWLLLFLGLSALLALLVARYVSEPANRAIRRGFQSGKRACTKA
jgi:peptidoglycan/LPS O-acetylase OafA/YrhL